MILVGNRMVVWEGNGGAKPAAPIPIIAMIPIDEP